MVVVKASVEQTYYTFALTGTLTRFPLISSPSLSVHHPVSLSLSLVLTLSLYIPLLSSFSPPPPPLLRYSTALPTLGDTLDSLSELSRQQFSITSHHCDVKLSYRLLKSMMERG